MRRTSVLASLGFVALAVVLGQSCTIYSESSSSTTNTPDAGDPDAGETNEALAGLEAAVDVVIDDRGMPHIYAASLHDAALTQGYLMARDRFPQMELFRRNVTGRLAEFVGPLDPSTVQTDIVSRVLGFKRTADKIYDSYPSGHTVRIALDAFAAGVNIYIAKLKAKEVKLPPGSDLIGLLLQQKPVFTDWTPQDSLAIGRYLSYSLSYAAEEEYALTDALAKSEAAFPAGDPREAIFTDLWSFAPARDVFTRDGFPNLGMDMGTHALIPPPKHVPKREHQALPSMRPAASVMKAAKGFFDAARHLNTMLGDESRGSNNWLVAGSKTASGAPIMSNDPHLALPAPPLFYYSHLSTKRAGGDIDVEGLALCGVPGIILGFNENIAWGSTTANHDVSDIYMETITDGAAGQPDTVAYKGKQVPIEIIKETIKVSGGNDVVIELENVPHHGIILPDIVNGVVMPRTSSTALSVRWTGDAITREVDAFLGLNNAKNVDEARKALDSFEVGAQSFIVASKDGDIFWSTQSWIPVRDPAAMTYDPATRKGLTPAMVLPGDGTAEWTGKLDDLHIPHDLNPAKGFIATANNDLVGAGKDGNPFDDTYYVGWDQDPGYRIDRITERLTELTQKGGVTPADMSAVQGDHKSPMGRLLTPALIAAADRVAMERATPGTAPDLAALVKSSTAEDLDALAAAKDRLKAWTSFETPTGVDIGDGDPSMADVKDSVATSIFAASLGRIVNLTFGDETGAMGASPSGAYAMKALHWAILDPARLATYDAGMKDTILWDDLSTAGVMETRDERIARGMLGAVAFLRSKLGADMEQWRWGKLHTLRFGSIVPSLGGPSPCDIPLTTDAKFPAGFPRPGDNFGVDAANYGAWSTDKFAYGSGPQQRLVVEMTKDGPKAWNAIPGGQHFDPESKHHADEAEHWRRNVAPPLYFTDADVNAHVESKLSFKP